MNLCPKDVGAMILPILLCSAVKFKLFRSLIDYTASVKIVIIFLEHLFLWFLWLFFVPKIFSTFFSSYNSKLRCNLPEPKAFQRCHLILAYFSLIIPRDFTKVNAPRQVQTFLFGF